MFKHVPNILTIIRFLLIPFIIYFLAINQYIVGVILFIISGITDVVDGAIARKFNFITDFGKLMDPLADKLLVCSALIALVDLGKLAGWIVIVIIAREFIISGFRLVASDNGVVIAASYWGKFKTTFQMIMIILLVLDLPFKYMNIINMAVVYIALALTVISLIDYIAKNYKVFIEGSSK